MDFVVGPGTGLQVRLAPLQPPLPVAAERFLRVADLAALDALDQATPRVPGGTLAGEAALRRLGSVAAAVDKSPANAFGSAIRVDASASAVARGVAAARGWGDLGEWALDRPRGRPVDPWPRPVGGPGGSGRSVPPARPSSSISAAPEVHGAGGYRRRSLSATMRITNEPL